MIDYKGAKKCARKKETNWSDFLQTCLMVVAVLALFALATYEIGKPGGALDHVLFSEAEIRKITTNYGNGPWPGHNATPGPLE